MSEPRSRSAATPRRALKMEMRLAGGQGHEENKWGQSLQSFTEQIFRSHNSRKARFPAIPVISHAKQTML